MRNTAALLLPILAATAQASQMSPSAHPRTFCELAASAGYPSRGFNAETGGCGSNMKEVTPNAGRNGLTNNLAYYARANSTLPSKLHRVSLILNVNNTLEQAKAHAELLRLANTVGAKIVGATPPDLAAVVVALRSNSWDVGQWSIQVKSEKWPTGLGYDISVFFVPKP